MCMYTYMCTSTHVYMYIYIYIYRSEGVVAERRIFFLHALQGWSGRDPRFLRPYARTSVRPSVRAAGLRPAAPPFPKNIKTCSNVPNRSK